MNIILQEPRIMNNMFSNDLKWKWMLQGKIFKRCYVRFGGDFFIFWGCFQFWQLLFQDFVHWFRTPRSPWLSNQVFAVLVCCARLYSHCLRIFVPKMSGWWKALSFFCNHDDDAKSSREQKSRSSGLVKLYPDYQEDPFCGDGIDIPCGGGIDVPKLQAWCFCLLSWTSFCFWFFGRLCLPFCLTLAIAFWTMNVHYPLVWYQNGDTCST